MGGADWGSDRTSLQACVLLFLKAPPGAALCQMGLTRLHSLCKEFILAVRGVQRLCAQSNLFEQRLSACNMASPVCLLLQCHVACYHRMCLLTCA